MTDHGSPPAGPLRSPSPGRSAAAVDVSRWIVPDSADGARIDRVLPAVLDESRAKVQARLERGEVSIDDVAVGKSHRVRGGDCVVVAEPQRVAAPQAPERVPVRYADDDVAVVAKPPDLVVHAGAGVTTGTLVDALRAMGMSLAAGDDPDRPGIVHRLDRGTSGLMVVARTDLALRNLRRQFDEHTVSRRYWALVDGVPDVAEAVIDAPIARHPQDRTRFQTASDGRAARTHYVVRESWGRASRVDARLETGRTHQVRVHIAALGHPVSGDRVYGASAALARDLDLTRPALHAAHLAFAHPRDGRRIALDEPLPEDLVRAVARLAAAGPTR
jgi:23S rRNA pseudouridine1911/1915/1917 synthase